MSVKRNVNRLLCANKQSNWDNKKYDRYSVRAKKFKTPALIPKSYWHSFGQKCIYIVHLHMFYMDWNFMLQSIWFKPFNCLEQIGM